MLIQADSFLNRVMLVVMSGIITVKAPFLTTYVAHRRVITMRRGRTAHLVTPSPEQMGFSAFLWSPAGILIGAPPLRTQTQRYACVW